MALLEELHKTTEHLRKHREPHHADAPIVRAANLSMQYQSGFALEAVNFELQTGERLAAMADRKSGNPIQLMDAFTRLGHAEKAFEQWARDLKWALAHNP